MTFGTVFTFPGDHARTIGIKAVAKINGLELEMKEQPRTPEHLAISKLGKVPAFVGADGFKLFECIAIAIYITKQNKDTDLLGKTEKDYANILKWMSFFNIEIVMPVVEMYLPLVGVRPYDFATVDTFEKMANAAVSVVEDELSTGQQHLVGDSLTLADIFCAGVITLGYQFFYGREWRERFPHVTRWYKGIIDLPVYADVTQEMVFLDEPKFKNEPPQNLKTNGA